MVFLSRIEVWASLLGLAGFLAFFWMIRGAPIGQRTRPEPDEAPGPRYRDQVVAAAVLGFLLILVGALLASTAGIPYAIPAFALGFGVVILVLRGNHRHRHASPTIRRLLQFSHTALTASLLGGVLVVLNVFAFRYGGQAIDLTRDRAYTLESLTRNQLATLDRPTTFTVYHGNSEPSVRRLDRIVQLLDQFKAANPRMVRVVYLDVVREANEFEALVKRYPDVAASTSDGLLVVYGEGEDAPHALVSTPEMFERAGSSRYQAKPDRFVSTFRGEDAITSALVRLREGKRSRVAFATGHGEPSIMDVAPGTPGPGLWRARLEAMGTDAVEVNILHDDIPSEANLLVVVGPKSPFQEREVERIRTFIARGGSLIVLVGNAGPSGLEDLLRNYNVELGKGVAVDPRLCFRGRPDLVYAPIPAGSDHPIVDTLVTRPVLLPGAAPITILGPTAGGAGGGAGKAPNPGIVTVPFLKTGPESWAETGDVTRPTREPDEAAGPLVVGVAATVRPATPEEKPTPRMVVLSSPYVADNRFLGADPNNLDLLMNAVHWLRGKPELRGLPGKTHESLVFDASPNLRSRLVVVPTLMAIVVILGLGVSTYLARRD